MVNILYFLSILLTRIIIYTLLNPFTLHVSVRDYGQRVSFMMSQRRGGRRIDFGMLMWAHVAPRPLQPGQTCGR